jgi:hypothetical protein
VAKHNKTSGTVSSKASDQTVATFSGDGPAASEQYPERRPLDVDVADIKNPDKKYEGEHDAPLNLESWVKLDGKHKLVPKHLDGALASVVSFPTLHVQDEETGEEYDTVPPKAVVTVKERSQGTILHLPREAFAAVYPNGRTEAIPFA